MLPFSISEQKKFSIPLFVCQKFGNPSLPLSKNLRFPPKSSAFRQMLKSADQTAGCSIPNWPILETLRNFHDVLGVVEVLPLVKFCAAR